jgi:hypothetical protein
MVPVGKLVVEDESEPNRKSKVRTMETCGLATSALYWKATATRLAKGKITTSASTGTTVTVTRPTRIHFRRLAALGRPGRLI